MNNHPRHEGRPETAAQDALAVPPSVQERLRSLPSVDALHRRVQVQLDADVSGDSSLASDAGGVRSSTAAITDAVREALAAARHQIRAGHAAPSMDALVESALRALRAASEPHLRPLVNATGVVINTNLGRAPLSKRAIGELVSVASSYSNLEYDLTEGSRGSRHTHVAQLICTLTGAERALVVNNNAAAVLVALAALTSGKEVIISRGELVEIGGGFRIPDVLRQSGARLVEVGTTNKTRLADFAAAITDESAALLSVHPSNFRVIGFTETPALSALADLARTHGLPLLHDLGSGSLLPTESYGLQHEPTPQESIAAGADLVCFSGDKLLGGPQAGILAGRAALLDRIAVHPLMRAIRIDKLTLAALEGTLHDYADAIADARVPVIRMLALTVEEIRRRADQWVERLREANIPAVTVEGESAVGGGSLPGETLPTVLVAIAQQYAALLHLAPADTLPEIGELAARLRRAPLPVVARVLRGQLLLDPRTVLPEQDDHLITTIQSVVAASR